MERWVGRTAVVTNATNDTGKAICQELLRYRMKVVSCDIQYTGENRDPVEFIHGEPPGELHMVRCNMLRKGDVNNMFIEVENRLNLIDVCINISDLPRDGQIVPPPNDDRQMTPLDMAIASCLINELTLISDGGKTIYITSGIHYAGDMTFMLGDLTATRSYLPAINEGLFTGPNDVEMWKLVITPGERLSTADFVNAVIHILSRPPEQRI